MALAFEGLQLQLKVVMLVVLFTVLVHWHDWQVVTFLDGLLDELVEALFDGTTT